MTAPAADPRSTVEALGTVLGVWAHPDDEAYLSAGVMAMGSDAGNRVVCVTATRGELGTDDPDHTPEEFARVREAEVAASLACVGVTEHRFLDYVDGTCAQQDEAEAVGRIEAIIREVAPDTIVTFGPEGMTGHPDHRAVSYWTTAAWAAGDRRAQLLWATKPDDYDRRFRSVHEKHDVFFEGGPPLTSPVDLSVYLLLPDDVLDRKLAALRAQPSQTIPLIESIGEPRYREWVAEEAFVRVTGPPSAGGSG